MLLNWCSSNFLQNKGKIKTIKGQKAKRKTRRKKEGRDQKRKKKKEIKKKEQKNKKNQRIITSQEKQRKIEHGNKKKGEKYRKK